MKDYLDYMMSGPMTDGEEIRSFFDDDEEEDTCDYDWDDQDY